MARTIVALYDDFASANKVIQDLINQGYLREKISFVSNDVSGEHARVMSSEDLKVEESVDPELQTQHDDLKRVLFNLDTMKISGIGPVLVAGALTISLSGSSELVKALISLGVPEQPAHYYTEGVRRGGTLIALEVSHEAAQRAIEVLNTYSPVDMKKRVAQWLRGGWGEFDPKAESLSVEQLWLREKYRKPEEALATSRKEQLWPRDEFRTPDEKAEAEEEKLIYPRAEFRAESEDKAATSGFTNYESDFRSHFETSVSEPGTTFDQYRPAYRYGYNLALSGRFKEYKEWKRLEPVAKRYWNERNPGTWERYQASVRRAWEEVKGIKIQPAND